ncbi:Copper amine oxidase N-terminal domain-containing protein [Paenibacillus tianmuensis]|uniref:Copper amine oxidase N-terminal domain-containing protein n=1 Tax=Paenibacillus tianmuensis TaxID=624147 RepID=A0A1G4R351_9BACL|nr:stalk domain-containing protein [Paenibacillus tianmuensis]SCW51138.1 Copper amine oxidase N-terminal domain-containing protein [Paenibacillus tianmuensis]
MKKLVIGLAAGMMLGSVATAFAAEDIGKEVKAVFAKFNFKVNGVETPLETSPLVYEGTAYLPVREIGKLTGYNVSFNEQTQTFELANVTGAMSSIPAKTQDPGAKTITKSDAGLRDNFDAIMKALMKRNYKNLHGGMSNESAEININDKLYTLKVVAEGKNVKFDITPLLDEKLITLEEIKAASEEGGKSEKKP